MAGKATNHSVALLEYIFQATLATAWNTASFVLAGAAGAASNLYVSLHTADPMLGGSPNSQAQSEAAYTGYARVAVARTSGGWAITSQTISNAAAVTFPASTSGPESETFFGIGLESTTAGVLLYSGALTATLVVNNGVTPTFAIGQLTVTEA